MGARGAADFAGLIGEILFCEAWGWREDLGESVAHICWMRGFASLFEKVEMDSFDIGRKVMSGGTKQLEQLGSSHSLLAFSLMTLDSITDEIEVFGNNSTPNGNCRQDSSH